MTGLLLVLWGVPAVEGGVSPARAAAQDQAPVRDEAAAQDQAAAQGAARAQDQPAVQGQATQDQVAAQEQGVLQDTAPEPAESAREAAETVEGLGREFAALLPKLGIAVAILIAAWLLAKLLRGSLRRLPGGRRGEAASALGAVVVWILALGIAVSVLAGDVRALVGSLGLVGLALSWALQSPIESFSAWLLNAFKGHYRVGDRIAVGDVFGDVYRIDVLTTTVWEAGGPDKSVQGAQPTGALTTFPNSELLRSNIVNYTRDFPFVWDEVTIGVANESDLDYAAEVAASTAEALVGEPMREPAERYMALLQRSGLGWDIANRPQVFVSQTDSWTNLTIRYLVPARERRAWSSRLVLALNRELAKPDHAARIKPAYPVTRVELEPNGSNASD